MTSDKRTILDMCKDESTVLQILDILNIGEKEDPTKGQQNKSKDL